MEEWVDNNNTPKAKGNGLQIQSQSVTASKIFFFNLTKKREIENNPESVFQKTDQLWWIFHFEELNHS